MRSVATLILTFFVTSAIADDRYSADFCKPILSDGIKNNFQVFSVETLFNKYKNRYCDTRAKFKERIKSGNADGEADILGGLLGKADGNASYTDNELDYLYTNICESTFRQSDFSKTFFENRNTLSAELAKEWNRCNEIHGQILLARGTYISVSPSDDFSNFSVDLRTKLAEGSADITGISPANVECSTSGVRIGAFPYNVNGKNELLLNCTKSPLVNIDFKVNTSAGISNEVRLPAQKSKLSELNTEIALLKKDISVLGGETKNLQNEFDNSGHIKECRVCFSAKPSQDKRECNKQDNVCSRWSKNAGFSNTHWDDTSGRGGGCSVSWKVECR